MAARRASTLVHRCPPCPPPHTDTHGRPGCKSPGAIKSKAHGELDGALVALSGDGSSCQLRDRFGGCDRLPLKGTNPPPSCSGSRAQWHWPVQRTGAADARWHAGGPAPPAATGPGRARAASPARVQGQQGLEASCGPGGGTKISGGG